MRGARKDLVLTRLAERLYQGVFPPIFTACTFGVARPSVISCIIAAQIPSLQTLLCLIRGDLSFHCLRGLVKFYRASRWCCCVCGRIGRAKLVHCNPPASMRASRRPTGTYDVNGESKLEDG
jgi:hypothetical protein